MLVFSFFFFQWGISWIPLNILSCTQGLLVALYLFPSGSKNLFSNLNSLNLCLFFRVTCENAGSTRNHPEPQQWLIYFFCFIPPSFGAKYENWSKLWCGVPHNHRQPNLMMGGVHKLNCCTFCKIISKYQEFLWNCDRRSRIANKEIELQSTIFFLSYFVDAYSYLLASQERLVWSILTLHCGVCLEGRQRWKVFGDR